MDPRKQLARKRRAAKRLKAWRWRDAIDMRMMLTPGGPVYGFRSMFKAMRDGKMRMSPNNYSIRSSPIPDGGAKFSMSLSFSIPIKPQ